MRDSVTVLSLSKLSYKKHRGRYEPHSAAAKRSAEAERKSCGHTETEETNPVFGALGLSTGSWVCYMYFTVLGATRSKRN